MTNSTNNSKEKETSFELLKKTHKNIQYCITCKKCKHTARRLYYQKRIKGQKQTVGLPIAYCEECEVYTILEKIPK